jgi:hypothetical protein
VINLYKPNIDIIRKQAQLARDYDKKKKEEGEFKWGEIREGDGTVLRPLPCSNSRGVLAKKVAKHYFSDTPLREFITDSQSCPVAMFPGIPGLACPICNMGDRVLATFPQLDISRWHHAGSYYYIQAVDRADPVPISRLFRLPPAIHNWLNIQMEALLKDGIDLTDINQGVDIKLTKIIKKGRHGDRTSYDKTLWMLRGVTPISPDPNITNATLASMVEMDEIWKVPDDEALASINKAASDIMSFYMKKSYQHPGAMVQVPGMGVPMGMMPIQPQMVPLQTPAPAQPVQTTPAVQPTQAVPIQQPALAQPVAFTPGMTAAAPPVQPTATQTPHLVAAQIANLAAQVPAQQVLPTMAAVPLPVPVQVVLPAGMQPVAGMAPKPGAQPAPTDKPACFGGASNRKDGGVGYSSDSEYCLMCPHELQCMDKSKAS